jgi:hypothetical protein
MSEATPHQDTCLCLEGIFDYRNIQETNLGGGTLSGQVSLITCKICGRHWLSIFYEPQIHDNEYAWFHGLIKVENIPSIKEGNVLQNALAYLESLDWYYTSGIYWSNHGFKVPFKTSGKIILWS